MMFYDQYVTQIKATLDQLPWRQIQEVVDVLHDTWLADRQVFIMGNGGSASTASHMACDLGKNTAMSGTRRLRVMSLNDNMALFSAHANDNSYANVFAEQLSNFICVGDVVIAISASGNSPNVIRGNRTRPLIWCNNHWLERLSRGQTCAACAHADRHSQRQHRTDRRHSPHARAHGDGCPARFNARRARQQSGDRGRVASHVRTWERPV